MRRSYARAVFKSRSAQPTTRARVPAAVLCTALFLSGCSASPRDHDGASEAAQQLAGALSESDLSDLQLTEGSAEEAEQDRAQTLSGTVELGSAEVTVADVSEPAPDGSRTASLRWKWELAGSGEPWAYDAAARLVPSSPDPSEAQDWAVEWERAIVHPSLADHESLRLTALPGQRGRIKGSDGAALVTERPVHRVGLDRSWIRDDMEEKAARDLAEAVDIDPDDYAASVAAHGPDAFVEATTLRQAEFLILDNRTRRSIPGVRDIKELRPLAPTAGFAREILGTVGPATQEDIEASGGRLEPGDMTGHGGLQQAHDERLSGHDGIRAESVGLGSDGTAFEPTAETLMEQPAVPGEDLQVSLDQQLQLRAEETLNDVDSPSAIVALRPSTGEVLAAANGPGSQGLSTALQGQYAPGSTFKIATSLGLLRQGLHPDSELACPPRTVVEGTAFANAPTYPDASLGQIPLRESVAQSCNTSFVSQHDELDQPALVEAAESLGLGQPLSLGVPAFEGSMPQQESGPEHAAAMIGQGRTLVSPLTMAVLAATVSEGELVRPRLVLDPAPEATTEPASPQRPLSPQEAADLQELMRAVVVDGHLQPLGRLSPDTAIGKTGTAEYGLETPPRTHSWVIAAHEDLAVAVFVEDGDYGSVTGTPLMLTMLEGAPE